MRLRRLDLTRYGKFTDRVIDFGERPDGSPDLHIVYGPNEAGKSTALAAFLDILYKIGNHYNFLHSYDAMRVGACLEFGGRIQELVRIKRNRNDLLDGNERPVPEAIISGELGGIDRQSYRAMFSLDDETLEAGGESILASKGDLGELLFSASTGLADLSRTLTNLRAEADGYYKLNARTGELRALKDRLAALKSQRDDIDTIASGYAQLIATRDRALVQYNEAISGRAAIIARMDQIQHSLNAMPRMAALREAREKLVGLGDLPTPPAGWSEAVLELQKADTELSVRTETIDREIARKASELEAIVLDESALAVADQVERLGYLHSRYVADGADIPDRSQEVRELDVAIAGTLVRIGQGASSAPERFVLEAATVGELNDLVTKHSGIDTASRNATKELSDARYALEEALTMLREAGAGASEEDNGALAALAAVASEGNDHGIRRRAAERTRDALQDELAARMRALHPWRGDTEQLVAASVPEQRDLMRWKSTLAKAQANKERCAEEVERLTTDRLRIEAEHAAFARAVSDQDTAAIRAAREAAWANHRRALDADSADSFEIALRRDDLAVEARLNHQADLAKLHECSLALARAKAAAIRGDELHVAATVALQRIEVEIAIAVAPFLPAGASIDQLETWLAKREGALDTNAKLQLALRESREVEADAVASRQRLLDALGAAGVHHDPNASAEALRALVGKVVDRETQLKALRTTAEQCRSNVKSRERNHAAALQQDQDWREAWQSVCSTCWLGETGSSPSLTAVRGILPAVEDLRRAIAERAALTERINGMRANQAAFADAVNAIASQLGVCGNEPLALEKTLMDRVDAATAARSARAAKARELEQAREERRELDEARGVHSQRKAEMTGFFAVGSLDEVAEKLTNVDKKVGLEKQADGETREILDMLRLTSIEAAEGVLENADRSLIEMELLELKARYEDQDRRSHELFSIYSKAVDQVDAVGGDAAVAKIEQQRRTILLEIEEGARRYLRLRLGIVAAEHALRSYRQHHRGSMMSHASEAFRMISRGAYTELVSQTNRDKEELIAIGADGSSKIASALSKGTRFQLYLALRVAGYHEFARMRPPVPFIADDIMETFDDFRAEEAIRLLADMGGVGQVIYLTHHRHLCDIAQRVCPGVRVHELSS